MSTMEEKLRTVLTSGGKARRRYDPKCKGPSASSSRCYGLECERNFKAEEFDKEGPTVITTRPGDIRHTWVRIHKEGKLFVFELKQSEQLQLEFFIKEADEAQRKYMGEEWIRSLIGEKK
jgi:hypothetical protein